MSIYAGLTELQQRNAELVWRLTIGGLPIVYYGGRTTPSLPSATDFEGNSVSGMTFRAHRGLVPPSRHTVEVDMLTGLPRRSGGLSVALQSLGYREDTDADDPVRVLGRQGTAGADWVAELVEAVPHQADGPSTIKVSEDPSGLTFPRLFYIGQEAIWATGSGGAGTEADPYTLTGVKRGVLGSPVQLHVVNRAQGDVSFITDEKVNWDGSPVTLEIANRRTTDGSLGPFVEVLYGFLDGDPTFGEVGDVVEVSLAPLEALVNTRLSSGQASTRLLENYHLFAWPYAHNLWHRQSLPTGMVQGGVGGAAVAGVGYILTDNDNFLIHQSVFDPDVVGRATDDPRRGPIFHTAGEGEVYIPDGYATGGVGDRITIESPNEEGSNTPINSQASADRWWTVEVDYDRTVELVTEGEVRKLYRWPLEVAASWNAADGFNPQDTQGADGAFLSLRLALDTQTVDVTRNSQYVTGSEVVINPFEVFNTLPLPPSEICYEPFAAAESVVRNEGSFQLLSVPSAFYHANEPHILVEDDAPATPPFDIVVKHVTRDGAQEEWEGTVTASTAVLEGATTVGYRWDVTPAVPSLEGFANYGSRPEIKPVIRLEGDDIVDVLRNLLVSGAGQGVNDDVVGVTADVYPFGLNLRASRIDLDTFGAFPRGVAQWKRNLEDGADVRQVAEAILHLLGAALVTRIDRSTGAQKIALVPTGAPNSAGAILSIAEADIHGHPKTEVHREIVNRYDYIVHLEGRDEPITVPVDNRSSYNRRSGGVEPREIDLEGLVLYTQDVGEIENVLRLAASRTLNFYSVNRRRYMVRVPIGLSYQLSAGDDVLVTHPALIPMNPGSGRGLSSGACRVVRIERSWSTGLATLTLEHSGTNTTGYAPALEVESITDADTLVVKANEYTATTHPIFGTAQTDLGLGADSLYFEVGDTIEIHTEGDWSNRVTTTITDIDYGTRSVTTALAHGAAAGDIIEPGLFSVATARMGGYAFLGPLTGASNKAYG